MSNIPEPFLASGVSLGIPNSSATDIESIDNVIFLDESGNLHFKDAWIPTQVDVNGNPLQSVTLKDLWTKNKGVYVSGGKLYFKDDTVSRAYSLSELVSAYRDTKSKFVNGGLWWVGSKSITNAECNNVVINNTGDPELTENAAGGRVFVKEDGEYPPQSSGTKVFSIDKYLEETSFEDGDYKTSSDGSMRWHDIENLQLLVPPVDATKVLMLMCKLSFRSVGLENPVMLRLFDKTTGTVIDQISIGGSGPDPIEQHPILNFVGILPSFASKFTPIECECPTEQQSDSSSVEPLHIIQAQFYVDNSYTDSDHVYSQVCSEVVSGAGVTEIVDSDSVKFRGYERRLIGIPNSITSEPLVSSNISCVIFDITKEDIAGRKSGSVEFSSQDFKEIKFDKQFSGSDYSVSLSCNKNINVFYGSKKSTGFVIRAEKKFSGTVDWIATKIKNEGVA